MNKFSLGLGMGLGSILISYYYYKKCIQNNEIKDEIKLDEIKDEIKLDEIKKVDESELGQDNPNIIIKDILDEIIENVENVEKNVCFNENWTIIE